MKKLKSILAVGSIAVFCGIVLTGCAGATGEAAMHSTDPTERGCGYIAAAIVTSAVLRALFNK